MSSMPATAANAAAAAAARTDEAQPDAEPSLSRAADPEAVDPASDGPAGTEVDPLLAAPAALVPALQRRGFERLTPVQCAILDADDGARDLRITSQTGSGKTVALGFALAAGLERAERQGPTTLVIAPTRELAMQVAEELRWLFADLDDVRCGVVTGGTNVLTERLRLRRPPTVLVGTPGRLLDHLREGALDLSGVCQLVLDEADQMLDLGFKDELDGIVDQLPDERRTHLVSATFPRAVLELANRFQREPLLIEGTAPDAVHADIEHIAYKIGSREHYGALVNLLLLAGDERTLVFVRTREDTVALADRLHADGFAALPLNGDLAQRQRTRTLDAFKQGTVRTLIATDVAARGLDVESVTRVVHVHPPIDSATYVHRSGRTGRAGNKGQSLMFVTRPLAARAERLYRGANVEPRWTTIPGRAAVYDHKLGATAAAAAAAIAAAPVAHPNLLAAAKTLLAERDPAEVVAVLLRQQMGRTRAPFELQSSSDAAASAPSPAVTSAPATARHEPVARRERRASPAAGEAGFTRFRINWGYRGGADPRRILAHVCRRGGIDSKMVGAIRMETNASTFHVGDAVAASFARRVKVRDRRDPHLVIVPVDGPGRAAPRRPR